VCGGEQRARALPTEQVPMPGRCMRPATDAIALLGYERGVGRGQAMCGGSQTYPYAFVRATDLRQCRLDLLLVPDHPRRVIIGQRALRREYNCAGPINTIGECHCA
jgi:hypothetical protein